MKFAVKEWWEIAPNEEVPWTPCEGDDRKPFVQVFDAAAAEAMHNAFQNRKAADPEYAGLLIDWDHDSTDDNKSTAGAGWIIDTKVEGGKLLGKPRLSSDGERDVEGGVFRFTSPTIPPASFQRIDKNRMRPTDLDSVAITNRPRCKTLAPISNAIGSEDLIRNTDLPSNPEDKKRRPAAPTQKQEKTTMLKLSDSTVAVLLQKLGLKPEEATDESVAAALGANPTSEESRGYKNRISTLEGELADLSLDAAGIEDTTQRATLRPLLIANRDGGKAALSLIVQARGQSTAQPGLIHNRAATKNPGATVKKDAAVKNRGQLQREAISAELINNRSNEAAYYAAKAKNPELFQPEPEEAAA